MNFFLYIKIEKWRNNNMNQYKKISFNKINYEII